MGFIDNFRENKQLKKSHDSLQESFNKKDREHSRQADEIRYSASRDLQRIKDEHTREVERLRHDTGLQSETLINGYENQISEYRTKVKTIELETEEKFTKRLNEALVQLAELKGENAGLRMVIEEKDASHDRVIEFIEMLLPKIQDPIDLAKLKLNLNIDAPVNVIKSDSCSNCD